MPASELSKRDADALGVADMTGAQLRMRVFQVEGLMCELALVVEEMLRRFAPDDDGLGEAEIMCAERAREAVASVRERYCEPQYDAHTFQLTKREMDVAREWIAFAITIPSDHPDQDRDNETAESVIAKLEALGARGTL
jgi:hypothetical protein